MPRRKENLIFRGSPYYYEKVRGIRLGEHELDFLSINMPPACNYRCQFCFAGMNRKRVFQDTLTTEETLNLLAEAKNLGAFHIEISGEGEPLLYRETLESIINFATFRGMHTTIFTNGSLLIEDFIRYLAQRDASLAISMDYLNSEHYEQFVGRKNVFDKVMRNIELARRIFSRKIMVENGWRVLPLAIHTIVMRNNIAEIPRLRKFAGETIFFSLAPLMNQGNARKHSELFVDNSQARSVINAYSDGSLILSDSAYSTIGGTVCGTFHYGIGVRYNGEVLFDAHAYDTSGLIGNIKNEPLRDLVKKLRRLQRRYYERFYDGGFCPLRSPNFDKFVQFLKTKVNEI